LKDGLTSPQEAQWVLRAQLGDREAIESLLRSVQPMLTRYVRAVVGERAAEDVTQEVMVRVYRKLWMLSSAELFRPWMFRIASREAFHYLKRRRQWPDHLRDDDALEEIAAPDLARIARDVDQLLEDPHLTPPSRAVLALHFKEGFTLPEVAAILDVPLGTVKSRLAYGLATLRRHHLTGEQHD
jgi:RNA polymerase sigma-70 factor (ECF subfamily)